ncbi:tetratricopeptide repeat protein [uncultured Thiodictyon sp.]|uniref:tetratricopeptide repeat protein n=1 Tax=uncultured Thiodictyon sp. TaxID=1846217 RepID=UPI0025E36638|nr:tetratricopeptide repeat protein [uncultured Thiodictyon sp.]
MSKVFLSHSSHDDATVRALQQALADLGEALWIDSRELRGGDPLGSAIRAAIESAAGFAVLVSPHALQSKRVLAELRHAIQVQRSRQGAATRYPVVSLALDGTPLGEWEAEFGDEPIYVGIDNRPNGIESALNAMLVALHWRAPTDRLPMPRPQTGPLEELVLELTGLGVQEVQPGVPRPSATARLIYRPADPTRPPIPSADTWPLIAPLGPIETEDLRWYLEKYAVWPSTYFADRARRVEAGLIDWGRDLHRAALPPEHATDVLKAWSATAPHAGRRFSVHLEERGRPAREDTGAGRPGSESASALLALPWELLHDGTGFLFQGTRPTRVRRRLPNPQDKDPQDTDPARGQPLAAAPIRLLLVVARPQDEACGYIDHRASALPLVETMEALGGLVDLRLLEPPTLPALSAELKRAYDAGTPYHCVHFDGHGLYDRQVGLGALCFEDPRDRDRPDGRRHLLVHTDTLGPLLRDHRIPLVFLDACQSAQAQDASESVASGLLKVGVGSVVAMNHSVLVETARRFVLRFYQGLAEGKRVGDAMLDGQRGLKDDDFRGQVFGTGELRLADWFVPVLYQGQADPPLFAPAALARLVPQVREDLRTILKARLGALPDPPETGFVGRSRDLLALERMLRPRAAGAPKPERWALIRGQGGEGKTALACELARWLVRSGQVRRAAFVSVENHTHAAAVLDALGHQLVGKSYSVAALGAPHPSAATAGDPLQDLEQAILPIERALAEHPTLLVIDNLESILPPPYLAQESPQALREDARDALTAILALCDRLLGNGQTRLLFTSRETLPAPFAAERRCRELERLAPEDAVRLIERALEGSRDHGPGAADDADDATRESIDALVEAVHGHARTLALLAPSLRALGVERTRARLADLMAEMDRRYPLSLGPGSRERSVFASVELSLERLAPANRERAAVLGVFHGGVDLDMLRHLTGWEQADCAALAEDLIRTGLATADPYNHLTLNPALCPSLRGRLGPAELDTLTERWVESMGQYVAFLVQQYDRQTEITATLTGLEIPNLLALLDRVQGAEEAEATIGLSTSLYQLLQRLGRPRLLARIGQARDAAAQALARAPGDAWTHARFEAERTRIEQQWAGGRLREALAGAEALLRRARTAGESAYPGADYHLGVACFLLARIHKTAGGSERALPLLDEARQWFETIVRDRSDRGAEGMASTCITERGSCLLYLGRLDESAAAFDAAIALDERSGAERDVAVGKGQLGTVRLQQRRYPEALAAYAEARERFTRLDEPGSVAVIWHQTGMAYQESGNPEPAEDAYRRSLTIKVRLGDTAGQASTLGQLGNLYNDVLNRPEDAAAFYRQSADLRVRIGDTAKEGLVRSNLANTLRRLRRLDEARREIQRAIECYAQFGHAVEPWTAWAILAAIETDAGNPDPAAAARSKAVGAYLDYRRAGGENHLPQGRIALAVTEQLRSDDPAQARALLAELARDPNLPEWLRPFLQPLDGLCTGRRDPGLAQTPGLDYTMSAELLLLIETLPP